MTKSNNNSEHTPFLGLDITIGHCSLIAKIDDKREDFSFPIVNFLSCMFLLVAFTFHNLLDLRDFVVMYLTSMNEVYTSVKSFQSRIPVSEIT